MSGTAWWVWKFGGSSVKSRARLESVAELILQQLEFWQSSESDSSTRPSSPLSAHATAVEAAQPVPGIAGNHLAVIVSALGGVTNLLEASVKAARAVLTSRALPASTGMSKSTFSRESLLSINSMDETPTACQTNLAAVEASLLDMGANVLVDCLQRSRYAYAYAAYLTDIVRLHLDVLRSLRSSPNFTSLSDSKQTDLSDLPECSQPSSDLPTGLPTGLPTTLPTVPPAGLSVGQSKFKQATLLMESGAAEFEQVFFRDLVDVANVLQTIATSGSVTESMLSLILGYGEIWSVQLLRLVIQLKLADRYYVKIHTLNAREVLTLRQYSNHSARDEGVLHRHSRKNAPRTRRNSEMSSSTGFLPRVGTSSAALAGEVSAQTRVLAPPAGAETLAVDDCRSNSSNGKVDEADETVVAKSVAKVLEEYDIGGQPGVSPRAAEASLLDTATASWAFPPVAALPKGLFPPCGLPSVETEGSLSLLPKIDWLTSYRLLARWFRGLTDAPLSHWAPFGATPVRSKTPPATFLLLVTGFVCKTLDGMPRTLQRNGSDTSAVAFAALLRAEGVTVWSDVAGIFTCDPRDCADARQISFLSYDEALELAGTGAKVLHPASLLPCMHMGIPMLLKNTFSPAAPGTTIADCAGVAETARYGKAIAKISDVCLLTLYNHPLISVVSFASRLFAAIEKGGGVPLFLTQGMSNSGVSVAVSKEQRDSVLNAIAHAFKHDAEESGSSLRLTVDNECSILSVVGRGQVSFVGALAQWTDALKTEGVNIKAVSQSSSELSTSFVIATKDEQAALRALHGVVVLHF